MRSLPSKQGYINYIKNILKFFGILIPVLAAFGALWISMGLPTPIFTNDQAAFHKENVVPPITDLRSILQKVIIPETQGNLAVEEVLINEKLIREQAKSSTERSNDLISLWAKRLDEIRTNREIMKRLEEALESPISFLNDTNFMVAGVRDEAALREQLRTEMSKPPGQRNQALINSILRQLNRLNRGIV